MTNQLPTHPAEATLDRSGRPLGVANGADPYQPAERVWTALPRADEVPRWAPYAPDRDLDAMGEVPLPRLKAASRPKARPSPVRYSWPSDPGCSS